MKTRFCRDHVVLARWLAFGRVCLLLEVSGSRRAVYEPTGDEPLVELPAAALLDGIVAFRKAFAAARRVIETGRSEREAWQRSLELQDGRRVELGGIDDQSSLYARSLSAFERAHGRGYPMTEDLTR